MIIDDHWWWYSMMKILIRGQTGVEQRLVKGRFRVDHGSSCGWSGVDLGSARGHFTYFSWPLGVIVWFFVVVTSGDLAAPHILIKGPSYPTKGNDIQRKSMISNETNDIQRKPSISNENRWYPMKIYDHRWSLMMVLHDENIDSGSNRVWAEVGQGSI